MKQFIYLLRSKTYAEEGWTEERIAGHMERWGVYMNGLAEKGCLLGGEELFEEGQVMTSKGHTDGPFAEGKEIVGGYLVVKAADYDEARALAADCPVFEWESGTLEVRELKLNEDMP